MRLGSSTIIEWNAILRNFIRRTDCICFTAYVITFVILAIGVSAVVKVISSGEVLRLNFRYHIKYILIIFLLEKKNLEFYDEDLF